ncbi:MAG: hypothetical protein V8S81_02340 [Oscillospiraceae bacterium]
MTVTAFLGTIAGSYCGFLFSRHSPDGLGYISMLTTVFLGVKFLVKPITGRRRDPDAHGVFARPRL